MFFVPMFVPPLLIGFLWLFSSIYLYLRYVYTMSAAEQQLIWGCLKSGGWLWALWSLSALLSAAAFVCSWVMLVGNQGALSNAQSDWGSSYVFLLPCIELVQAAYNVVVLWGKDAQTLVCCVLWAAVACNTWLWVGCYILFPTVVWLHVLNAIMWLHGLLWDAGVWFVSWSRELRNASSPTPDILVRQEDSFLHSS